MPIFNDLNLDKWKESEIWTDSLWIIPERDKTGKEPTTADREVADYIWFTPRAEEKDYCASLRQQSSHEKTN